VTINMHLKHISQYRCLSYAPSHMILASEHPNQRCSSLRVTSLKLIFLNMDHEALWHELRLIWLQHLYTTSTRTEGTIHSLMTESQTHLNNRICSWT